MATHLDILRLQARELPESPGVYFWKDSRGKTLYIGKAINLRSRVTSYFSNARREARTRDLLGRSRSIEHQITSTELQALFLESALIKKEQPPFNRLLRVSRRGYYLKFDGTLEHPYMEAARDPDPDSLCFGPFRSGAVLRETMRYLHDVLPLRKCTAAKPRCRPCIYFQMATCAAPLIDEQHAQLHREAIERLFELLDGRSDRVTAWLEAKRDRLSEALLFERAAEIQDRLNALRDLLERQTILEAALQCRCVLVHHQPDETEAGRLLLVAHGNVLSVRDAAAETQEVVQWIIAHDSVIKLVKNQQSELDAASVFERWLKVHRKRVRWAAISEDDERNVHEQVAYVLGADETIVGELEQV